MGSVSSLNELTDYRQGNARATGGVHRAAGIPAIFRLVAARHGRCSGGTADFSLRNAGFCALAIFSAPR
jgi:hypothetical protein